EPARVESEARGERAVLAQSRARVAIQRGRVAGEGRLEAVHPAVAIVVANRAAHAGLRLSVLAVGAAGAHRDVGERAVAVVAVEGAPTRVVGHVEIDPA